MTPRRTRGFTMIEMLVAVAILGVVVAGAMQTFVVQNRAYTVVDETTEAQQNLRAISYLIERDVRSTGFMVEEGAAACGIDKTDGPDTLFLTDSEPINPEKATTATLGATVTAGYTSSASEKLLTLNDVVIDRDAAPADAYFDTSGDGVPDSDFVVGRGAILVDTSNPGRGTACGLVTDVNAAGNQVRVDFQNFITSGGTLVLVPAVGYSIQVDAAGVSTLMRNGLPLARDVEDLQVAYFIDLDENGKPKADGSEYPGSDTADYASQGHRPLQAARNPLQHRGALAQHGSDLHRWFRAGHREPRRGRCQRRFPPSCLHVDRPPAEHRVPRRPGERMRSQAMRRRESGSALIITVLVMLLLGAIGISALDTVMRDQQVAGYQNRASTAFYAAEAGVAQAKDLMRRNVLSGIEKLSFADQATAVSIGDSSLYPEGQPKYYGDPKPGSGKIRSSRWTSRSRSQAPPARTCDRAWVARWNNFALWKIRVAGQTPDGAVSRIEVVTLNQIPGGY